MKPQRRLGGIFLLSAALSFLAALVLMLVLYLTVSRPANAPDDVLPWVFAGVGFLALLGWWWDRANNNSATQDLDEERRRLEETLEEREKALGKARDEADAAREQQEEQRRGRQKAESRLKQQDDELGRERYLRSRAEEARRTERNWSKELQAEVMRMYREGGPLGGSGDVPSIVLRLATTLLEADKGLLLSRSDENGELLVSAFEGFEHNPSDSRSHGVLARKSSKKTLLYAKTIRRKPGADNLLWRTMRSRISWQFLSTFRMSSTAWWCARIGPVVSRTMRTKSYSRLAITSARFWRMDACRASCATLIFRR